MVRTRRRVMFVYALLKDGTRTFLFRKEGDFDASAWIKRDEKALLLMGVKRIETETLTLVEDDSGPH